MATPYVDVYNIFMQQIKDYNLDTLYASSTEDFEVYLKGFLQLAIDEFVNFCSQDLTDRDDTTRTFNFDLTDKNLIVLARSMVKFWLKKEIDDINQMKLHLTDRDFKHYSEAQNLKSKNDHYITLVEEVSQIYVDYQFYNIDWDAWNSGNFGG